MVRNNEEHAFIRIEKDIKTGKIPGLVVLQGTEEYLVQFYSDALFHKYVSETCRSLDLVCLDRDTLTSQAIIENMETISLMSERKVVYIENFIDPGGKLPKHIGDKPSELESLKAYLKEIPEGALLLLTVARQNDDRNLKAGSTAGKFLGEVAKVGRLYDFGRLGTGQLRGFIEKRFRSAGKTCRSSVIDIIARDSGYRNKNIDYGLYELENDLRKILAHAGNSQEVTGEDVLSTITINPENNIFAMLDAMGRNHKDEALRLLHNLLENGTGEFQILSMITSQLELMLITREMNEDGMNLASIQSALKKTDRTNEYRTKKALEAGRAFRTEDVKRILSAAFCVDVNIKTGLYPGPLALELFIAGI